MHVSKAGMFRMLYFPLISYKLSLQRFELVFPELEPNFKLDSSQATSLPYSQYTQDKTLRLMCCTTAMHEGVGPVSKEIF